jgi:hypothetical protein
MQEEDRKDLTNKFDFVTMSKLNTTNGGIICMSM